MNTAILKAALWLLLLFVLIAVEILIYESAKADVPDIQVKKVTTWEVATNTRAKTGDSRPMYLVRNGIRILTKERADKGTPCGRRFAKTRIKHEWRYIGDKVTLCTSVERVFGKAMLLGKQWCFWAETDMIDDIPSTWTPVLSFITETSYRTECNQ